MNVCVEKEQETMLSKICVWVITVSLCGASLVLQHTHLFTQSLGDSRVSVCLCSIENVCVTVSYLKRRRCRGSFCGP